MSSVVQRLEAAGLMLPSAATPVGSYVSATRTGSLVFTSGQLPVVDGELMASGLVGDAVSLEAAQACAQRCALNCLAAAATVCDLDEVVSAVKLVGYVASATGFTSQPAVINGASDVLTLAFGDSGKHAREAVGVAALPLGAPVEVSLILALR